jgi:uncharacterized membrane protein
MADQDDNKVPRGRLEALTDGVFAFAMTLLVLNLELPDDFSPATAGELLDALADLRSGLLSYIVSFVVLALFWHGQASNRSGPETAGGEHFWAVLALLFFTTVMPFSTQVVGRYGLPPAVWFYAANMVLLAVSALAISRIAEKEAGVRRSNSGRPELYLLIASALLSVAISFFSVEYAVFAYLLNMAKPLVAKRGR